MSVEYSSKTFYPFELRTHCQSLETVLLERERGRYET